MRCKTQHHPSGQADTRVGLVCLLLAAAVLLSACPVRFIGDYDDVIDKGVIEVQEKTELYLSKRAATPPSPYDVKFYDEVNAKLTVLESRATMMPKYTLIHDQLASVKNEFADMQRFDEGGDQKAFSNNVGNLKTLIDASIESIERLELALKERGKATTPALTGKQKQ
jgi:hypothetical protein